MKFLKYLFFFIIILIIVAFIVVKAISESKPETQKGAEADLLAEKMMDALNHEAFDSLKYIKWTFFRPGQKYVWDKQANKALIYFDEYKVIMNLNNLNARAFEGDLEITGKAFEKIKAKAWSNWCNDSFWIFAPFKLFDSGTERSITEVDGQKALMIEYKGGGVTPGDAYLWLLDPTNKPTAWKMWTKIIPIKGINTTWENWEANGEVLFSTKHKLLGLDMELSELDVADNLSQFGLSPNTFDNI